MDERNPYAPARADLTLPDVAGEAGASPRAVPVGRGARWVVDGLGLIKRRPLTLLALSLAAELPLFVLVRVAMAAATPVSAGILSLVTGVLNYLLHIPVFALYMLLYEDLDRDRTIRRARVAAVFREQARSVLALSGIYLVAGELLAMARASLQTLVLPAYGSIPIADYALRQSLFDAPSGVAQAIALGLVFSLAPALSVLQRARTASAIKRSLAASFMNLGPMVVSALLGGLAMLIIVAPLAVATFLVLGPVALGTSLLLLSTVVGTPIKAATSYYFYRDAFDPR